MRRMKNLLILLAVLAALLGATELAHMWNPENVTAVEDTSLTVFTLDADSVTQLSWEYSEALTFVKNDGKWAYAEDAAFSLDESYIETILDTLTEVVSEKTIENAENLDQYGLEIPICSISVTADEAYTLAIGEETSMGGQRYLSNGDGNVYLVDSEMIDAFAYGLYDLLEYEQIPEMETVTALNLTGSAQSYRIEYIENSDEVYSDSYVWFMDGQTLDTELTQALISSVAEVELTSCVDYNASDLSEYGLDFPAATVTLEYAVITGTQISNEAFILHLGDQTAKGCYARIGSSKMVYLIDGTLLDTLLYTTASELLPDEILAMDWTEVTRMDITLGEITYTLCAGTQTITDDEGNEAEETVWLLDDTQTDISEITALLDTMTFAGYAASAVPALDEEIRFVIHRDHAAFPEIEIAFYRYDSSACLTTLNGQSTVFTLRSDVVGLVEAVNTLVLD